MSNTGITNITMTSEDFYKMDMSVDMYDLRENDYVIFKDFGGNVLEKFKVKNGQFVGLTTFGKGDNSFKPLNPEQECYFDLLNDDSIPIKVAIGIAGTGKTKCAIKFGLRKLFDKRNPIDRILLVRNPVEVGKKIGFLKGDKDDKLANWNNPAKDNLENETQMTFEEMVDEGLICMDIPSMMQGRDIKNTWIIVDEAQQLTHDEVKMLGCRVSEGSQIIFIGDLDQTFLQQYKTDNGLRDLYNIRGLDEIGIVELADCVRSATASIFATKF